MSILDEGLPPLEDLEPEELKYLRKICAALKRLEYPQSPNGQDREGGGGEAEGLFDADELGLDPEFDNERW
ncbi:unnamed protein product [marine sediment metagenome]|uniref:Uncharacterized protein n=1 Tax=marine sediment metagenome TaxID=412755 RepID=X1TGI4_9ZZZZ